MRDNPIKQQLSQGGYAFGMLAFEFFSPGLPQIVKAAGADFILFDMEHSGAEMGTMKTQFALCRGIGLTPIVRVPTTQYHFISRVLDAGAMGVMVPMVDTKEQAEFIVSSTRYPPLGQRGAAFGVAHDDYMGGSVTDKIAMANSRTLVICQIETAKGLKNVNAIASVPGVDVLWLGHFDLTNFMGIPAQFDNPKYLAGVDKIIAACRKYNKVGGFMPTDSNWSRDYIAKGFKILAYSLDIYILQNALREGIADLRRNAEAFTQSAASEVGTGSKKKDKKAKKAKGGGQ